MTTSYIAISYGLTVLAMVAHGWRSIRRGRALAAQLPDEDKPWT